MTDPTNPAHGGLQHTIRKNRGIHKLMAYDVVMGHGYSRRRQVRILTMARFDAEEIAEILNISRGWATELIRRNRESK